MRGNNGGKKLLRTHILSKTQSRPVSSFSSLTAAAAISSPGSVNPVGIFHNLALAAGPDFSRTASIFPDNGCITSAPMPI